MVAELEAELDVPPFPMEVAHIWTAWARIRNRTANCEMGLAPLGWLDIKAFVRLTGQHLSPPDIELIEVIDDAYLAAASAGPSPEEQNMALRDGLEQIAYRGNPELTDGYRPPRPGRR